MWWMCNMKYIYAELNCMSNFGEEIFSYLWWGKDIDTVNLIINVNGNIFCFKKYCQIAGDSELLGFGNKAFKSSVLVPDSSL